MTAESRDAAIILCLTGVGLLLAKLDLQARSGGAVDKALRAEGAKHERIWSENFETLITNIKKGT